MRFFSILTITAMSLLLVACDGSFKLSGKTSGLSEGEVVLTITGSTQFGEESETITITDNSVFSTTKEFTEDTSYTVEISSQPDALSCSLNSTTGTVSESTSIKLTCESFTEVVEAEMIILEGEVLNLKESIQLINTYNNETIVIEPDSTSFKFDDEVSTENGYNIEIVANENEQTCVIENGLATLTNDDPVILRCELPFIALNPFSLGLYIPAADTIQEKAATLGQLLYAESAYIEFIGRAEDYSNHIEEDITLSEITSFNELSVGNFQLSENDENLSQSETYPQFNTLNYTTYNYDLVILIDTSSSLSNVALENSKQAALNLIKDPVTNQSRIQPNQTVSIVTYDFEVHPETIKPTNNLAILEQQINAITHSANSSSLTCGVYQSLFLWDDFALITERDVVNRTHDVDLNTGSLVVISDGIDTAGTTVEDCYDLSYDEVTEEYYYARGLSDDSEETQEEEYTLEEEIVILAGPATTADRFKRLKEYQTIYVIRNGEEYVNNDNFETITETRNIFTLDTIDSVIDKVYLDIEELQDKEHGLFYYSYVSPNRSGDEITSKLSLKYTQASGSSSSLFYTGVDTGYFYNYVPSEGFKPIYVKDSNEESDVE